MSNSVALASRVRRRLQVRGRAVAAAFSSALLLAGCGGAAPDATPTPTAEVQIGMARNGSLSAIAKAYGVAVAAPGHNRILVMPYEGAIAEVQAHIGESVAADQPLVSIARTPAAAAQFAQARSAQSFAQEDLARVQRLAVDKLATNEQVATARKALADAQAELEALNKAGADTEQSTLRAPFAGVITTLTATPGDRPAVGSVIATVSSPTDIIVQLGLEPADAARLAPGAPVLFTLPGDGDTVHSKLSSVGKALDSTTRLVAAVAPLPASKDAGVTLGMTLLATIDLPARSGVVVARSAVLEDEDGPYVFTVVAGKAHRQGIQIATESGDSVLVMSGLSDGTAVIVDGNAGLEDGVAVTQAKPESSKPQAGEAAKDEPESKP